MITEEQQKKDERYMRMALDEAQTAYEAGEIPIGAVVVCKDRVISRAHNLTETLCDVTAHAEMQAIGAIGWAQLPRIVYGCADDKRGYHDFAPHAMHPKATVISGVLEEECRQLMQDFFKSKR